MNASLRTSPLGVDGKSHLVQTKVSSVENRKKVEPDELSAVTDRRVTNHGTLSGDISDPVKQQDKPYNDHT